MLSQQISSYPVLNSPSSMSTKLGITTVFTLISTLWTKLVIHSIITEKNFLRIFHEKKNFNGSAHNHYGRSKLDRVLFVSFRRPSKIKHKRSKTYNATLSNKKEVILIQAFHPSVDPSCCGHSLVLSPLKGKDTISADALCGSN